MSCVLSQASSGEEFDGSYLGGVGLAGRLGAGGRRRMLASLGGRSNIGGSVDQSGSGEVSPGTGATVDSGLVGPLVMSLPRISGSWSLLPPTMTILVLGDFATSTVASIPRQVSSLPVSA